MTRYSQISGAPRDHVADPDDWTATLSDLVPVRYAQALVRNLDRVLESMTIEDLAERSGVDRSTIWALRTGRRWPDLLTVSRLEWNLRARIWPLEELLFADARTVDSAQDSRRANRRQSLKGA